jgi:4-amino-4-deoxy-L-arabinose transferase-like glycosyltransferase
MKNHLLILLVVTLLTRGILFISYPMGGSDDDQSAHRYQIDQLISGNLLIGNLRYHTGYPLVIAPVAAVAQFLGRYSDRLILLIQVGLSAFIPLLVYDILRARRRAREGLIAALVVALDPFGLQWAHFALPNWLIAFCVTLALWLIHRGLLRAGRLLMWTALAGVVMGIATLARLNLAPIVALMGGLFFLFRWLPLMQRWKMFAIFGVGSAGILALYTALIHYPSTGTWSLSCYTGTNLLVSVYLKGFDLSAENGPATRHLLELMTLKPPREIAFTNDLYPRWSEPGSWATEDEYDAFINQPYGIPETHLSSAWPGNLFYYLGPCATDVLLLQVHDEAVHAQPVRWLLSIPTDVFNMLVQQPIPGDFHPMYLPRANSLHFEGQNILGFQRAYGDFYNGQWVWRPGIVLYSALFDAWNLFKWVAPFALVWALFSREWFYGAPALMLLAFLISMSIFGNPAPRLYAPLYPFTPLLIGGFATGLFRRWLK